MTSNIDNINKCSIEDLKKELKDKPQPFKLNYENAVTLINFYKIFKDLIIDLKTSFNDKVGSVIDNNKDYYDNNLLQYYVHHLQFFYY